MNIIYNSILAKEEQCSREIKNIFIGSEFTSLLN